MGLFNIDIFYSLGPACWLWDYLRRSGQGGYFLPLSGGYPITYELDTSGELKQDLQFFEVLFPAYLQYPHLRILTNIAVWDQLVGYGTI
jgi:hypothetical protein